MRDQALSRSRRPGPGRALLILFPLCPDFHPYKGEDQSVQPAVTIDSRYGSSTATEVHNSRYAYRATKHGGGSVCFLLAFNIEAFKLTV